MEDMLNQTKLSGPNIRLKQARTMRNWTQQDVADALGVTVDAVRYWENGRRSPSPKRRTKLCELFGMSAAELGLENLTEARQQASFFKEEESRDHADLRRRKNNRRRMIGRVREQWIDGILHESLHKAALIALGFRELPEALENPWRLALPDQHALPQLLPPGTSIVQVYDEVDGDLLILGEPGAGKTTLLLELARVLLRRADQNEEQPIPVIFPLSSWAAKQLPLDEWLEEEMFLKYHVPRRVGEEWIRNDQLVILLDGLDEVTQASRSACVQAINLYKDQHEIVPVVVYCRVEEYFAAETRVGLRQAVQIQPLTAEQIDQYIASIGKPLANIRSALNEDVDLQELAKSPLMLSILTLTYRGMGKAGEKIFLKGSIEARRRQILEQYVQRMLVRRVGPDCA